MSPVVPSAPSRGPSVDAFGSISAPRTIRAVQHWSSAHFGVPCLTESAAPSIPLCPRSASPVLVSCTMPTTIGHEQDRALPRFSFWSGLDGDYLARTGRVRNGRFRQSPVWASRVRFGRERVSLTLSRNMNFVVDAFATPQVRPDPARPVTGHRPRHRPRRRGGVLGSFRSGSSPRSFCFSRRICRARRRTTTAIRSSSLRWMPIRSEPPRSTPPERSRAP